MSENEILNKHQDQRTKCTIYTRVMGYHRPVETFNIGKKGEFMERNHFIDKQAKESYSFEKSTKEDSPCHALEFSI